MWHLLHPALVHFSVAFLIVGGACEALGHLARRDGWIGFGNPLILIGTISLVPTLVSGYIAANTTPLPDDALGLLASHERNGWFVLGVFVAALFWKAWNRGRLPERQRPLYAALLLAGVLLAAYSAFLGGRMVYERGIGVNGATAPITTGETGP